MNTLKTILLGTTLSALMLSSLTTIEPANARGGGGHGGGGGGFRGGGDFDRGGDRGFGDRGFGDRGLGDRGFGDRGLGDDRFGRGDDGPLNHVSESALRDGADRTYGGLATDGMRMDAGYGRNLGGVTRNMTDGYLADRGSYLRNNFNRYDAFRPGFWANHPNAWWYRGWGDGYAWGGYGGWDDLAGYWGVPASDTPTEYDYGDNITYQNDDVYYGSQPVASTADYYAQAQTLATTPPNVIVKNGQPTNTGLASSWKPLGVYSLSQNGEPSTTMFQLAVNKDGTIRGNFYDSLTETAKPIKGKVDKKSMRAAWVIEGNNNVVYEAGVSNLLQAQCPALVHKGKDKTEQWLMVKQDQSQKTKAQLSTKSNQT